MFPALVCRSQPEISEELSHLHPLLAQIYYARGVCSRADLSRLLQDLPSFATLKGIEQAVNRLFVALMREERIVIVGDFDADGATSTALAVSALRAFGHTNIDYCVPNRFTEGYGLSPAVVERVKCLEGTLIITVDNGIASHAGIDCASAYGIDVVVTDHHLAPDTLPNAAAIVNPNQPGCTFPSKNLAGVGVIFYVMAGLRARLQQENWFESRNIKPPVMASFLDLVALGTIADLVRLDATNRILVHQGLIRIRQGLGRPGIAALFEVSGRDWKMAKTADLGYAIGPRLNAAGRLEDMSIGIACLLSTNKAEGMHRAEILNNLNVERRQIEAEMKKEAFSVVTSWDKEVLPAGITLYQPDWHSGIVGLVASRVKEKWNRPAVAFAKVDDMTLKGSARSIEGLHIRDLLAELSYQHPDLIEKMGGHAMAAGLSISLAKYEEFAKSFNQAVAQKVSPEQLKGACVTDGELSPEWMTLAMAELLSESGPWGQGFPEPLFNGRFEVMDQRLVGQCHLKMTVRCADHPYSFEAIAFYVNVDEWPNLSCRKIEMVYRLDINEYQGRKRLQLVVEHMRAV